MVLDKRLLGLIESRLVNVGLFLSQGLSTADCSDGQLYGLLHGYGSSHGFTAPFHKWCWLQPTALCRAAGWDTVTEAEETRRKTRMRNRYRKINVKLCFS